MIARFVLNRLPAFLGKSPCFRKKAYVAWGRPGGAPAAPGGSGILPVSKESDLPVSPLSLYDDLLQFEERLDFAPQDIIDFGLEDATHKLEPTDIKRAQDALENDPFIAAHPQWITAIKQLLKMGVRAEQQALAKWGLNYVIEEYLPRKLASNNGFLP